MFWTEELYEKAYDIVKDRKFPIVIPSYNRPDPIVIKKYFNDFTEEYNWPVWFIVRDSQKNEYSKYLNENKYIKLVSFPDDQINDFGKVKMKCLTYAYDQGYKRIFSMDDDMYSLGINTKTLTRTGNYAARPIKSTDYEKYEPIKNNLNEIIETNEKYNPSKYCNSSKFFAVWQLASEICFDKYNALIVFPNIKSYSWPLDNIDEEASVRLICGKSPAHCLNVEEIIKRPYKYESDRAVGFSDLDFMINLYENKDISCQLPWLYYEMPDDYMSVQNYEWFKNLDERLEKSTEVLFSKHPNTIFIERIFKKLKNGEVVRSGVKLDNRKIRKDLGIDKFKFNIYEDIKSKYNI